MLRSLKTLLLVTAISYTHFATAQGVAINTTGSIADTNAMLDVSSTSKGMLVPRLDSAHVAAIASPATSMLVYKTDGQTPGFYNYNGSIWQKVGAIVQPHAVTFTTTGGNTFTTSANTTTATLFKVTVVGAGGGGGGKGSFGGGGGGAGAVDIAWISGLHANTAYTVLVGASGIGGTTSGVNGTSGGASGAILGSRTVIAGGGAGGGAYLAGGGIGLGGTGSGGDINITGQPGAVAITTPGGNGASSTYGAGGYGGNNGVTAVAGTGFGSGGGGASSLTMGANGAPGLVIIEWSE